MHANSLKLGLVAAFFVVNAGAQGEEVDDLSQYPSSPAFDANADWHRNVDQHEIRLSYFLDGDRRVAMRCVANLSSYQVETHREVHDHATQASKTRRLSHAQVLTLRELTRHLSASDAKPELANLLTVSLVEGETRRVITFDATKPPAAVIRLYDLTGAYLPAAVEFRFDPMPQVKDGANNDQRDERRSPEDVAAEEAYRAFITSREYGVMLGLVDRWKRKLNDSTEKEVAIRLMQRLGSTRATPLLMGEQVVIFWRHEGDQPRPTADGGDWTWQDLLIEGGRCAWALERLLEYDPPAIKETMHATERQAAVKEAYVRVVRAMQMPVTVNVSVLSEADRIKVANSERTHPRVLSELASDKSVSVRRAVASNRFTPKRVQMKMYDDPDPEVVKRAQKNFILVPPSQRPR